MTEPRDRYIRFDWAIKRLLRQKANFGVLEGFLTVFLNEPIKIVDILESEGNQQAAEDKFNRVDIKAKNSNGEDILVEIQNITRLCYQERIFYGVAKAITEHINLGNTYKEVKKVYSISILFHTNNRNIRLPICAILAIFPVGSIFPVINRNRRRLGETDCVANGLAILHDRRDSGHIVIVLQR